MASRDDWPAEVETSNEEGATARAPTLEGASVWTPTREGAAVWSSTLEGASVWSSTIEDASIWSPNIEGASDWPPPKEGASAWPQNKEGASSAWPQNKESTWPPTTTTTTEPECTHYKRNCKLQAKCCQKFYSCRFCHDEDNDHEMDRHIVDKIECTKCHVIQDVAQKCISCGIEFGEYFCLICRLFDVSNDQFHCDDCGICRVGPRDKFYHCHKCNACLSKELEGNHKCLDNISMSPCPICQELLHTSRIGLHIPRCGHMIHQECLVSYYEQGLYQCPLCKESMEDMTELWKQMDNMTSSVQMPEELANLRVNILCQDCHKECEQKFNTEGLKCLHCGGYNTTQI